VATSFRCSIVTPSESILDGEATYASIPAWDGQRGIMPGGSPLLARLGTGSLRIDFTDGGSRWYLIDGGFAEFHHDDLVLLSDGALPAETINLAEAQAELAEANARVTKSEQDQAIVQRQQQRAMSKIALAKAHAARGGGI